ncbi:MAG: CDP-alcohol phosphatidyltransferase family protein [Bacteroidales bacterium]|nr:CDP-alcohol phosphatidyltransferase family protein [Bacteroidales bacterium]
MMKEQSVRIQTSVLNGIEKKALVYLAKRQPKWMTSDLLTLIGVIGAALAALGYILSNFNIHWLWLSSAGYIINWYGDSLDGTLARVRHTQRPIYGFYLDHCVDGVTTSMICIGAGLSQIMNLGIAMSVLVIYLLLSISVYINAHLKSEFKLTYGGMGPTELRLILIFVNTLFIFSAGIRNFTVRFQLFGKEVSLGSFDFVAIGLIIVLTVIYIYNFFRDAKGYAEIDPLPKWNGQLY